MRKFTLGALLVAGAFLLSACTPGPLGTQRYQAYTGSDATVIYTQANKAHQGLFYFQRYNKEGDCFNSAEMIYISNNMLDGVVDRLFTSRLKGDQYWTLIVQDNSSGRMWIHETAFFLEKGKHYVAISSRGAVEIPADLNITSQDDLDKVYDRYKDKPAKPWNLRRGICKSWLSKAMGS